MRACVYLLIYTYVLYFFVIICSLSYSLFFLYIVIFPVKTWVSE